MDQSGQADSALAHLENMTSEEKDELKILLHSCCAPCSGAMIEELQAQGVDVTIFFYNPNIHPKKEYEIRKVENVRYAEALGIPIVDADYDVDVWYKRAQGMEFDPERGGRCTMCFDMRMERTASYAAENGFTHFTTTNATSRWKDVSQVNKSGIVAARAHENVEYLVYNWQTDGMTARKYKINAEQSFYKQEYCGCSYSLRDSNLFRAKEGLPPIKIGGGGIYSDPEADAEEESLEVVQSFFDDANSASTAEWRQQQELLKRRRKDASASQSRNNW